MTTDHQPVAEVQHGGLRWHLPTPDANPAGKFLDCGTHLLYDQAAIDAAVAAERERCAADAQVLKAAVAVMSKALDDLVGACLEADGKPKAPDRGALMRARAMLPPACKHALSKKA